MFVFTTLEDAKLFYRDQRAWRDQLQLWEAEASQVQPAPECVPTLKEDLWRTFWQHREQPGDDAQPPPEGSALCNSLMLTRPIDVKEVDEELFHTHDARVVQGTRA
jgi:hypothetical protein